MKFRLRSSAPVAGFLAVAVGSAIAASSASAVLQTLPNGHIVSYLPTRAKMAQLFPSAPDQQFGNLDYNGGPVMPANTDYLVAWSPSGVSAYGSSEYLAGLATYWKDLQADSGKPTNVDSTSAQYGDATRAFAHYKVTYGGLIVDTDPYPASQCPTPSPVTNCLTDAQIQAEVTKVAIAHHIPHDLSHELFIVTPPHVEGCFTSNAASNPPYGGCSAGEPAPLGVYCAYHQETATKPMIFYSDDPYVTGNAGCDSGNHPNGVSDGAIDGGMAHEHNESITDPIPNDAWTQGYGGPNSTHGEENGDLCAHTYIPLGTHNGVPYTQIINGHYYYYQPMWSNDGHQCLNNLTLPTLPKAGFTATAGSGLAMNFNAGGSGPSIADFSWQFNDSTSGCTVTCNNTVETTQPTISHTFSASGDYSVGLAVFQANGISAGMGGIIATGHNGFVPGFTTKISGLKVLFRGLSSISGQPVTSYLWEYGDGKTGTGAAPVHTYAAAGSYRVTVVEFSGVGSAFPGSGAAPIYVKTISVS